MLRKGTSTAVINSILIDAAVSNTFDTFATPYVLFLFYGGAPCTLLLTTVMTAAAVSNTFDTFAELSQCDSYSDEWMHVLYKQC